MPEYRRADIPGGTYFLTLVTFNRRPLFAREANVTLLRAALNRVLRERPFELLAGVVLHDHVHMLWELPRGDADFSRRIGRMKALFTKSFPDDARRLEDACFSRLRHRESTVWQRRFWEHTIRDDKDFERHVDYIHYNPVKHGLAECPHDWPHSSFHRWVREGRYDVDWCCVCEDRRPRIPSFAGLEKTVGE